MWKVTLGLTGLCLGAVVGFLVGITAFWLAGVLPGAIAGALIGGGLGVTGGAVFDNRRGGRSKLRLLSASSLAGFLIVILLAIATLVLVLWWNGW